MSECYACSCRGSRFSVFSFLLQVILIYTGLVFAGGTLINTGYPVAVELGQLIHTVTFIEPTIHWAHANQWELVESGLRSLARGLPV